VFARGWANARPFIILTEAKMTLDSDKEILSTVHSARGEFYAFLCRLFGNVPNGEFYQMLTEMSAKLSDFIGGSDNQDMVNAEKEIRNFLDGRRGLSGKELSDFELEVSRNYTTMFCLTKSIPVDESFYTSPEHRERGESYDQMKSLFKKYGINKRKDIPENEDFVSYEFLFMSKLAYRCAEYISAGESRRYEECLKEQFNFHINHFDKWINLFFERVINFEKQGENLYKHLVRLAQGFISEDKPALEALIHQCRRQLNGTH
jgi:TorA maturation chaperone TorD